MEENRLNIDVEKVLRDKNPAAARWLPGFVLRFLKRIVHQDEINEFLSKHGHKRDLEFVRECIAFVGIDVRVHGLEHIPQEGGVILASNHPLGGMDALALIDAVATRRRDVQFLVNDILMNLSPLTGLFVPVNKHGVNGAEIRKGIDAMFSSEQVSMIFPAGLVSRKIDGEVRDLEWKKTFIFLSKRFQRDIIPVYIGGENSQFFYGLANWRKRLGIKVNLEMLFLADELFKHRGKSFDIRIGKPIPYSSFTKEKRDQDWAKFVYDEVYKLKI